MSSPLVAAKQQLRKLMKQKLRGLSNETVLSQSMPNSTQLACLRLRPQSGTLLVFTYIS